MPVLAQCSWSVILHVRQIMLYRCVVSNLLFMVSNLAFSSDTTFSNPSTHNSMSSEYASKERVESVAHRNHWQGVKTIQQKKQRIQRNLNTITATKTQKKNNPPKKPETILQRGLIIPSLKPMVYTILYTLFFEVSS